MDEIKTPHSKIIKLPKGYWVKGKSKFLFPRLVEEGKKHISELSKVK